MKYKAEGDSTVIVHEENDYSLDAERRQRERQLLDKGGVVIVCEETGDCHSSCRPPSDYRIAK